MNQSDFLTTDVIPHEDGVYLRRDGHMVDIPYAEIPALVERLGRALPEVCSQYARRVSNG